MSIQILQYEFLGPIKLDEWGPPMEKVVYLIFSRKKDSFKIIYVSDCEKTEEKDFFVKNLNFQCWIKTAGSEDSLYLAILPLFESNQTQRKRVVNKILLHYHPKCNANEVAAKTPDYIVRPKFDLGSKGDSEKTSIPSDKKISCPCCGSELKIDKVLENTTILKCIGCGINDTRLNS
jgi:hypothetical protein